MTTPAPDSPQSDTPHLRLSYPKTPGGDVVATFEYRPAGADWTAAGDVKRGSSGLTISRLELHPSPTSTSGITGGMLRKVQVGELLTAVRAEVSRNPELAQEQREPAPDSRPSARRGGRAALTEELLREIAVAYLSETAPGQPAGAVKRMAAHFGRPEETIRTWIARARKDGWLGPSVKGRAGAEPGPRLTDVTLDEMKRLYPGWISHVRIEADDTATDLSHPGPS